ncbi:FAD-binding oxidoreductase [Nocardia amamiensis]|uniref:FAD-binding oxidoreductase n=1 Tax=Nocardia amamiensis TaxID=404578 RepID=A0ABS0CVR2_9NOCA|nr:FAD-dependent oxidoreductase [Nocardia amamiensis]MBF6300416.1 FAD-binding oxidoreductase [Nocardia amamiensis]
MTRTVGCVVVGGGIAGLMTSVRLAAAGWQVVLLERGLLGSGATTSNHGMIHSGALYARWHPEIVTACQQAQAAYRSSFPECLITTESCWYVATSETLRAYESLWRHHDIVYHGVDARQLRELIGEQGRDVRGCAVGELIIDTRALLAELTARCAALGVEIAVDTGAQRIEIEDGGVRAVDTAQGRISTSNVVVCAGIGTKQLLEGSGSVIGGQLSSRLEMMMAYPGQLPRPIIGLEFGWPALAPAAAAGTVLASRYGAVQRWVDRPGRWPVPAGEAAALNSELSGWLVPGVIDHDGGVAWVCSKTEHAGAQQDQWGTAPNYAVIDHSAAEGITGLWTVLPGKMTLALHASRELVARMTGRSQPLAFPTRHPAADDVAAELVAASPWAAHGEVQLR